MFRKNQSAVIAALMVVFLAAPEVMAQGLITTIAGTDFVFPAVPIAAINAPLNRVAAITFDRAGNLYVSDEDNSLILKIDRNGVLTIVAGNRIQGFSGDGGAATSASIFSPGGLAVDPAGNLFFADIGNGRVRKVASNGIITTVAGNGIQLTSPDGVVAAKSPLALPTSVAVDASGNLFIVEEQAAKIRKVGADGILTTVAGNGGFGYSGDGGLATSAMLNEPAAIAIDASGNLFIADAINCRIRKVTPGGIISTVAGNGGFASSGDGGSATNASVNQPFGVAVDSAGRLYIAETVGNRIRKISIDGTIATIAGTGATGFSGDGGPAATATFGGPSSIAVDSDGSVLVADENNHRVRKINLLGSIATVAGNGQYGFSGDNGPAPSATLSSPNGIAVDGGGNIYVADSLNNRVRRIGADGVITTVAGDGTCCFSGDGGPAVRAQLNDPQGVLLDKSGNLLIADSGNNRIRKIASNGTISTIVGSALAGFSGDGGPAVGAALRLPAGMIFDQAGNLLIADYANNRIRKVSPDGTISAIAGDGRQLLAGDGGPASAASLYGPYALALDAQGNLLIAENNNRIRKISNGVISTVVDFTPPSNFRSIPGATGIVVDPSGNTLLSDRVNAVVHLIPPNSSGTQSTTVLAGNGRIGFSGDGGAASTASLFAPAGLALDPTGSLYIVDSGNNRIRKVLAARPSFQASPAQMKFTAASGGAVTPIQSLSLSGSIPGLAFSAQSTTDWLRISSEAGRTPRVIEVSADPSGLQPGDYSAAIAITAADASPVLVTVSASFTVTAVQNAKLNIDRQSLSFAFPKSGSSRSQSLTLSNSGSGPLAFTVTPQTTTGGNWLSASPASAQVLPSAPVKLTVTADPKGLPPGTYSGTLTINDATLPVTMTISSLDQAILLSQTGLSFLAVADGGIIPAQTFSVLNIGTGTVAWSASKSTLSGDPKWLLLSPSAGTSDASAETAPAVTVSMNPAGLAPGSYYGQVRVDAPGAANTPQALTVFLQVLPAGSETAAIVQPAELLFASTPSGDPPGSQVVSVYNVTATPKSFRAFVTTEPGMRIVDLPNDATLDPAHPTSIVVQPFFAGLTPGVHGGTLTLQFSDGFVKKVNITAIAAGGLLSFAGGNVSAGHETTIGTCVPSTLTPAIGTLPQSFSVTAGWPVALGVKVLDDCGSPLQSGSVTVAFSNGDPPVALQSLRDGSWEGTWQTRVATAAQQQVTLTVTASTADAHVTGSRQLSGTFRSSQDPPLLDKNSIVSAASAVSFVPLAPGSMISIYGSRLADSQESAARIPLPAQLGNAQVVMAGIQMPLLYASDGQINAVVPAGVNTNTTQQIIVQRGLTYSQPVQVDVADAQPAIFSSSGLGIFIAYPPNSTPFLVSRTSPAHVGDILVVYCSGLGLTNPAVADGTASPASPVAGTANAATVTIGGQNAPVSFAGLVPGLVGLYQINTQVPAGVAPGDSIPVVLRVAGQASPAAPIAIR